MATNNAVNISGSGLVKYDGAGTFSAVTLTQHAPLIGGASNAITSLGPLTNGQLIIGNTSNDPSAAGLSAGTGISIATGAGSITINAVGAGLTWTDVTGSTQAIAVNSGYTSNDSSTLVTLTLPSTAAYGSVIAVVGKASGLWTIAQNSGQTIHFGGINTTTGTGGSLSSTKQYDAVFLLCTVANTDFTVINSIGNITYV
jgi:hypothetical protein